MPGALGTRVARRPRLRIGFGGFRQSSLEWCERRRTRGGEAPPFEQLRAPRAQLRGERDKLMTNFFVYMIGVILVVGALAYGASLLGLSSTWIAVVAIAALGLGVMGAIVKTRQKEPS